MHKLALLLLIPVGYATCNEQKTNSPAEKNQIEKKIRDKELPVNTTIGSALLKQSVHYYHRITSQRFFSTTSLLSI